MQDRKIKVLYIAGYERSGSTLLHNVLGQLDGFFGAGELREIWERSLIKNRRCGCGAPFKECEIWRRVLDEGFGGMHRIDAHEMTRLRNGIRNRHFPLVLLPQRERLLKARLGSFPEHLEKLYRAIRSTTNGRVIIDSSKSPTYGYVLGTLPAVDLYVVHIVRDPRGVQHSLLKRKQAGERMYLKHTSVKGSLTWDALNLTAETIWRNSPRRYLRLRFEDFIRKPRAAVERILEMMQERVERFPFTGEREVELDATHTVIGSPSRFNTGTVELRLDEAWREKMKPSDKAIVTTLTRPLLSRYGYLDE